MWKHHGYRDMSIIATVLNSFNQKGDFRTVTSNPDGVTTALHFGEEIYNSTTQVWWKNCGGTLWKEMNAEVVP